MSSLAISEMRKSTVVENSNLAVKHVGHPDERVSRRRSVRAIIRVKGPWAQKTQS